MENLICKLKAIPNSYFEFVDSVIDYIDQNSERLELVMNYLNHNPSATPSDVLKFITFQPDFFCDGEVHIENSKLVV